MRRAGRRDRVRGADHDAARRAGRRRHRIDLPVLPGQAGRRAGADAAQPRGLPRAGSPPGSPSATFAHWWDGVDAAIDEYIAMHRDVPGFRTLHFGDVVDVHLLDEDKDNNEVIAAALTTLLVDDVRRSVRRSRTATSPLDDRGRDRRRADQAGVPARPDRRRAGAGRGQVADPGVPAAARPVLDSRD